MRENRITVNCDKIAGFARIHTARVAMAELALVYLLT
jgi:hypothetical protein